MNCSKIINRMKDARVCLENYHLREFCNGDSDVAKMKTRIFRYGATFWLSEIEHKELQKDLLKQS